MGTTSELYINELKQALNHNHASVLIGSGFSLNADDVNPLEPHRMLTWYELADVFCEKLGIDVKDTDSLKNNRYLDPLILAEKVEAMYGRPFLDELLIDQMKDDLHKPSEIHRKLLCLPWSDVFTTNYDTLLEKTLEQITNKYCLVLDQNDLMHSKSDGKSRIVKLHGSFPSSRPFIITKEDYRNYPNDHAPFVNTVQQSLLENTFCLIGFSGDDPNFLSWIGWIRDNLGSNSPKIYMVTDKPVDKIKEKMFHTRNVEHIVLEEAYHGKGYRALLNAFLDDLTEQNEKYRNQRNVINWPDVKRFIHYKKDEEKEFIDKIQEIRKSYPGYITVPYVRLTAVDQLLGCFNNFFRRKKDEATNEELNIIYEYCWLTNLVSRPLFKDEAEFVETIIERHKGEDDKQGILNEMYFSLLYSYRMFGETDSWRIVYDKLKTKCNNEYYTLKLQYEQIMHHFYNLQISEIEKLLEAFSPANTYPDLILKKCCIVALLGRYEEAERLLKETLAFVRKFVSRDERENNLYHSLESCIVSLYNHVNQAKRISKGEYWIDPSSDKEFLNAVCEDIYNWDKENRYFSSSMTDYYKRRESHSIKYSFDVGVKTESQSFTNDNEAVRAYQFIGFREKTGHPFRIGNVTNKAGVKGAALRTDIYNLKIPILLYYLSGEKDVLEDALKRPVLSVFSYETVDELLSYCIFSLQDSLRNSAKAGTGNPFEKSICEYSLSTMPELISRLLTKCSDEKFADIFELLKVIYSYGEIINLKGVNNLARRFMENAPLDLLLDKQEDFYKISITEDGDLRQNYPDLVWLLFVRQTSTRNQHFSQKELTKYIEEHIHFLSEKYKNEKCPNSVINRLINTFILYNVGPEIEKEICSILWSKKNLDKDEIPNVGDYMYSILYELPRSISMEELNEILWRKIKTDLHTISNADSMKDYTLIARSIEQIVMERSVSKEEVDELLPLISKTCKTCSLYDIGISFGPSPTNNLKALGELTGVLLLKSGMCSSQKSYTNKDVEKIYSHIIDAKEVSVLLKWCISKQKDRKNVLEEALTSGTTSEFNSAVEAIYHLKTNKIVIPKSIIKTLECAFITANSVNGVDNARPIEFLIRENVLSKLECDRIASYLKKYGLLTQISPSELDDEIWGKKLEARKMMAILACTLKEFYEGQNLCIPEGVDYWRSITEDKEEFVEIRRTWDYSRFKSQ